MALEAYLKGSFHRNLWTENDGKQAMQFFNQAIQIDPNFALAWVGRAEAYAALSDTLYSPREVMPKAKEDAQRALTLADSLAEGHTVLASVKFNFDFDWKGAEQQLQRLIDLNPNFATAHREYGWLLSKQGRQEEALVQMQRAAELDPLSPDVIIDLNAPYLHTRRYDQAILQCRKGVALAPNYFLPHLVIGLIELKRGNTRRGIAELGQARSSETTPSVIGYLGYAYALDGQTEEARKLLDELNRLAQSRYISPFCQALIYLGLDDKEHALEFLEKAYESRSWWLTFLKVGSEFDCVRGDPRFQALLKKVGFDP